MKFIIKYIYEDGTKSWIRKSYASTLDAYKDALKESLDNNHKIDSKNIDKFIISKERLGGYTDIAFQEFNGDNPIFPEKK